MLQDLPHLLYAISATDIGAPSVSVDNVPAIAINAMLGIAGSLSVIFVIVGALQYVTSAGDPARLSSAKRTITYAIVGVVISALAFLIVAFVVKSV